MTEKKTYKTRIRMRLIASVFFIGKLMSWLYGIKISLFFTDLFNSFYSGWLSRNFKHHGGGIAISYPMHYSGLKYIAIGANFTAGPRLRIEAHERFLDNAYTPRLVIGDNVNINYDCHIGCIDHIEIGNNVLIASKVLIIDHLHGGATSAAIELPPAKRQLLSKGPIIIGNNVLIGEGSVIMPGVTIGANCIIGSNSVITKNFAANSVIGGNPAKIIRILE